MLLNLHRNSMTGHCICCIDNFVFGNIDLMIILLSSNMYLWMNWKHILVILWYFCFVFVSSLNCWKTKGTSAQGRYTNIRSRWLYLGLCQNLQESLKVWVYCGEQQGFPQGDTCLRCNISRNPPCPSKRNVSDVRCTVLYGKYVLLSSCKPETRQKITLKNYVTCFRVSNNCLFLEEKVWLKNWRHFLTPQVLISALTLNMGS